MLKTSFLVNLINFCYRHDYLTTDTVSRGNRALFVQLEHGNMPSLLFAIQRTFTVLQITDSLYSFLVLSKLLLVGV